MSNFQGSVTAPDGTELAGAATPDSATEATITLAEPLSRRGEYIVRHEVLPIDGQQAAGAYIYTFDPSSPPPPSSQMRPATAPSCDVAGCLLEPDLSLSVVALSFDMWRSVRRTRQHSSGAT